VLKVSQAECDDLTLQCARSSILPRSLERHRRSHDLRIDYSVLTAEQKYHRGLADAYLPIQLAGRAAPCTRTLVLLRPRSIIILPQ
jgi:hypothetical protein